MASNVTFLHTADFHIGAPMRGFSDVTDGWSRRLQRAIPEAFDRVIETALSNRVDFVIIAGDAFDSSGASYRDYLHFFEGLQRLDDAAIPVYLIAGNHDPYSTWKYDEANLPPSCHLLGTQEAEFALFEREGEPLCLIGARGYSNQAWPIDELIEKGIDRQHALAALAAEHPEAAHAPFCIGVIHTRFDPDQSKAYSNPQDLIAADVDYWACGHMHERLMYPSPVNPRIVFPGCIQGRDLKESGEHGCYVVTLTSSDSCDEPERKVSNYSDSGSFSEPASAKNSCVQVDLRFVPTASVVFHTVEVDVSACRTLADVAHHVQSTLFQVNGKARCDEMVERIILKGTTYLHGYLRLPDVIRDLRKRINDAYPSFFCDILIDRTQPVFDREAIMREGLFSAYALRIADDQRLQTDQMINYVQAEFVKRGIDVPTSLSTCMDEFCDAAEILVMDLLGEESL